MSEKVIKRAKVVLKEAKTYTLAGKKFIKDVPVVIKGDEAIKEFQANGYFKVSLLSDKVEKSDKSDAPSGDKKKLLKKKSALKKNKKA